MRRVPVESSPTSFSGRHRAPSCSTSCSAPRDDVRLGVERGRQAQAGRDHVADSAGAAPGPRRSSRPPSATGTAAPPGTSGPVPAAAACGPARCRCRRRRAGCGRRRAAGTRDAVEEGRLAGAVVADEAQDLAVAQRQADVLDRRDPPKLLLVVAAAEVVVGLGLVVAIFRRRSNTTADDLHLMKG